MAGVKQHYIPKLLLRGFKVPDENAEKVYLYRRGVPLRTVSIADICHGKYFYSDAHDTSLDDGITDEERDVFGPAMDALRKGKGIDEKVLRRFIVHLMVRTDVARRTLGEVAGAAGQGLMDAVGDRQFVSDLLTSGKIDLKSLAERALEEQMAKVRQMFAAQGLPEPVLTPEQRALILGAANRFNTQNVPGLAALVAATPSMPGVKKIMEERLSGERIQKNALAEDIAPAKRVEALDDMTMTVVDYPTTTPLILGDDPVVAFGEDGAAVRAVLPFEPPSVLVLPVMPTRALVLHRVPIGFLASAAFVNETTAAMSHAQFVAQTASTEFTALLERVGTFDDPLRKVNWKDVVSGKSAI